MSVINDCRNKPPSPCSNSTGTSFIYFGDRLWCINPEANLKLEKFLHCTCQRRWSTQGQNYLIAVVNYKSAAIASSRSRRFGFTLYFHVISYNFHQFPNENPTYRIGALRHDVAALTPMSRYRALRAASELSPAKCEELPRYEPMCERCMKPPRQIYKIVCMGKLS